MESTHQLKCIQNQPELPVNTKTIESEPVAHNWLQMHLQRARQELVELKHQQVERPVPDITKPSQTTYHRPEQERILQLEQALHSAREVYARTIRHFEVEREGLVETGHSTSNQLAQALASIRELTDQAESTQEELQTERDRNQLHVMTIKMLQEELQTTTKT